VGCALPRYKFLRRKTRAGWAQSGVQYNYLWRTDTEKEKMSTLYEDLKAAGVQIASHESDLYFPVTPESRTILNRYPVQLANATTFVNQVEGGRWFDVPFAYLPYWEKKQNLIKNK
jgi:hypothetical protein